MSEASLPDEVLSAYLDGECTDEERAQVEARLATDAAWRAELDATRTARDAVRELPLHEAPAGYFEALIAREEATALDDDADGAREPAPVPASIASKRRARNRMYTRLTAVGAVAASIVIGVMIATPSRHPVSPQLPAASDRHATTSAFSSDPISTLAPVAIPVTFGQP